jgi:PAS domain S-box-containing protein
MPSRRDAWRRLTPEIVVPVAYAVFSGLWIFVSDHLLAAPGEVPFWSIAKGWAFVLVTASLLHVGLRGLRAREREATRRLGRANEALRLLGRCNEAVVRAASEAELLSAVCRIVVEEGDFRLAWIGRAEHDAGRTLRPIASFGAGGEDLLGLNLTWAEGDEAFAPAGLALRSGAPCSSPDLRSDPRFAPFAAAAGARGLAAAIALPLAVEGEPTYVLALYAGERREPDDATLQVYRQLLEDLRQGLAALRTRAVLSGFLAHAPVSMFARTPEGRYLLVGKGWEDTFGLRREEVVGRRVADVFPGGKNAEIAAIDAEVLATGRAVRAQHTLELGGRRRTFDLVEFPILDAEGRISALCGLSLEVTAQRETERVLAEERRFLQSILDNAGVVVGVLDRAGRLVRANRELERVSGFPLAEVLGRDVRETMIAPDEQGGVTAAFAAAWTASGPVTASNDFVTASGERRTIEWVNTIVPDADGRPTHLVGFGRDVTELRRTAAALAENEERYRLLFDRAPVGISVMQDGRLAFANGALVRMIGASGPADLAGRPITDFLAGDAAGAEARIAAVLAGEALPAFESEYRRLDGTRFAAEVTASPFTLGGRPAVHLIAIDATERRDAQRRLAVSREQLRALAARIQGVREEEKARIARDLHDELGQLVTGLKMDLRWIERRVGELGDAPGANALLDRAVAATELADQTVATVQRLAADLRPGALDRLGLGAALRQEGRAFEARTGMRCEVELDDALAPLGDELATALYRIAQEAMTNVARHAGARRVSVRLQRAAGAVRLRVEDDGRGIEPGEARRADALGLLGMRERANALGGEVRVEGSAGRGTAVTAEIPLEPARGTG